MTVDRSCSKLWADTGTVRPHISGAPMRTAARHDGLAPVPPEAGENRAEQRSAPRFTLLIRSAKLVSPEGEYLCVVRNASECGVSVRLFHPLPPDVPFALELPNGDRHPLGRVWEEPGKAGFSFAKRTDIERIVEGPSRFSKRAMRVNLEVPCELLVGARKVAATLRNLSQQGALVSADEALSLVQRIQLRAEGMPEVAAKVRWRRNGQYGLSFEGNFQFGDLAVIVHRLRHGGAAEVTEKAGR